MRYLRHAGAHGGAPGHRVGRSSGITFIAFYVGASVFIADSAQAAATQAPLQFKMRCLGDSNAAFVSVQERT